MIVRNRRGRLLPGRGVFTTAADRSRVGLRLGLLAVSVLSLAGPAGAQLDHFTVTSDSAQTAGDPITVTITAADNNNDPIANFDPTTDIDITPDTGTLTYADGAIGSVVIVDEGSSTASIDASGPETFDGSGQATFTVTNDAAQTVTITVSDGTATGTTDVTWTAGAAHHLAFTTQPGNTRVGEPLLPVVTIQDELNNTVTGDERTILLAIQEYPSGGATGLGGTVSLVSVAGVAAWTAAEGLNIDVAGNGYMLRAFHTGADFTGAQATDIVDSDAFNITDVTPHHLAFTVQPVDTTAGEALLIEVSILDASDNVVTGDDRDITLEIQNNPAGGATTLGGDPEVTTVNGVAEWTANEALNINVAGSGYRLRASHDGADFAGSQTVDSNDFDIQPGPADHLAFTTQPVDTRVADPLLPVVTIQDEFNNTVTGDDRNITLEIQNDPTGGGATLDGTATVQSNDGVATWTAAQALNIDVTGDGYTLRASHAGQDFATSDTVDSNAFNITQGTAAQPTLDGVADGDGQAALGNAVVDVTVVGLDPGTNVRLETDADGETTITIGATGNPDLVVTVGGAGDGAEIDLSLDDDDNPSLVVKDADDNELLNLYVEGLGDDATIDVTIDDDGDQTVVLTDANGTTLTLDLNSLPEGSEVRVGRDADDNVTLSVTDGSGEAVDVTVETSDAGGDVTFTVTYNGSAAGSATARLVSGFAGLKDEKSLGGSVTISAEGLSTNSLSTVALTYEDSDVTEAGVDESQLRLFRVDATTGVCELAGTNDAGAVAPTGTEGDFGVDTATNSAWAVVSTLGTFAVGAPAPAGDQAAQTVPPAETTEGEGDETAPAPGLCGIGGAPCGPVGLANWCAMMTGMLLIRRSCRRRF